MDSVLYSSSAMLFRPFVLLSFIVTCLASSGFIGDVSGKGCDGLVDMYLDRHRKDPLPYNLDNMLYFLHVPRTAGRTMHSCFLKLSTPTNRRCPKAYDHLRINFQVPHCYLLSSHDDFSVVAMLPDAISVFSQIRDPVDRVLSAYEFATEVAARWLVRPANFRKKTTKIATEDVWPWSILVPFMADDIKQRVNTLKEQPLPVGGNWVNVTSPEGVNFFYNKYLNQSKWNITDEERTILLPALDPYNNPLILPLQEFVEHPLCKELLHNGATFQILGVTNYSHWQDSDQMRRCVWDSETSRRHMVEFAKKRIAQFAHVGTTDLLYESVEAAAVELNLSLSGPAYGGGESETPGVDGEAPDFSNSTAEDMPDMTRRLRELRGQLASAQKTLAQQTRANAAESVLESVKRRIASIRNEVKELTDAMTNVKSGGAKAKSSKPMTLGNPLGAEFIKCANRAQSRNMQRKDQSLSNLQMPDGRYLQFDKAARRGIAAGIISRIRELNTMDTEVYSYARGLLLERHARMRKEGKLQELPRQLGTDPYKRNNKFNIPLPEDDELHTELR